MLVPILERQFLERIMFYNSRINSSQEWTRYENYRISHSRMVGCSRFGRFMIGRSRIGTSTAKSM
jgi:hypothetical protein